MMHLMEATASLCATWTSLHWILHEGLGQQPRRARSNTKNQLCMMVAHVVQQLSSGAVLMAPLLTHQFETS
jgi:hypothetical protein